MKKPLSRVFVKYFILNFLENIKIFNTQLVMRYGRLKKKRYICALIKNSNESFHVRRIMEVNTADVDCSCDLFVAVVGDCHVEVAVS